MPVHKKHHNTPEPPTTSVRISPSDVPSQESFHQHLRELIRGATRVVMEEIMQEELRLFLGAEWGESTSQRRGYRNGSYTRDLVTTSGRIEDLSVPRDREGQFHTQAFERYSRYEPEVAEALTEMFVSGSSTHKIGKVANTLLGVAPSASSVSRLNESPSEQFEAWRTRPLQTHYRIVYLDGIHFSIRHGSKCDASIILTILGVDGEGNKEVLALQACAEESREGWLGILQDMRSRGATEVDLFVTDGHEGLLGALDRLFTATARQRCLVHKQRNVLSAIPRRERELVQADLVGIWKPEKKEDALANLVAFKAKYAERYPQAVRSLCEDEEHLLTFYDFPVGMHRHIQSTNAIEGFFSNVRQRTDQIDAFTSETSCVRLVWAVMQDIRFHKVTVS
ncbi:transposase for insertion sequence element IS905 [Ktedonobacter sp. SOSP1-52]|uniref:IS256 family transposase n=1 Tax=Ktedonobacter sp. SOSP1-52 TaxID=2778366 RepID=UPI001916815F|nr:IS256 family transposase [Ktedonobacter sp. SOSP1-52]GHO70622.1 transposase for insertion sequence element IS905 [Ktedonobacter sp. SOSP1-52]